MELDQIKELTKLLEGSHLHKLVFKKGDFELHLEKETLPNAPVPRVEYVEAHRPAAAHSHAHGAHGGHEAHSTYVSSPMVGTFYGSAAPDQPAFIKVGDRVHEQTIVCIVEAMKVMNEVKAGVAGTIAEVLVTNGSPVEFGSKLFRVV